MESSIRGVWTLQSFVMEDAETKERSEPFGPSPRGTLIVGPDGRLAALIAPRERTAATQAFVAYSGRYRLEPPDRIVTLVDVAWIDAWIGTDQVRTYRLEDDRLTLFTPPGRMPRPGGGEMTVAGTLSWTREAAVPSKGPSLSF